MYTTSNISREGRQGRAMHSEYGKTQMHTATPLVGYWKEEGFDYTDSSHPFQAATDDEARKVRDRYAQESVLKVCPNGRYDFV